MCREERFVSWAQPSLAVQRFALWADGGALPVRITVGVDGDIRGNPGKVYKPGAIPACDERGLRTTEVETCRNREGVATVVLRGPAAENRTAARAVIRRVSGPDLRQESLADGLLAGAGFAGELGGNGPLVIEKYAAVTADLPGHEAAAGNNGLEGVLRAMSFDDALRRHLMETESFWKVADVKFAGDGFSTLATRFAVWSTRIAAPLDGGRASIGPKNLTGDWYRGLLFWDMDIFQAPLLAALCPERAMNHVAYRARLLSGARKLARQDGYEGARYPFASPPDGGERPMSARGVKGQQLHVNLSAAYSVPHTWRLTGRDEALLEHGGLEVLLETARFWLSLVREEEDGRFHVRNITGPDELHQGVDDNYYTNELLARILEDTVAALRELRARAPGAGRSAARHWRCWPCGTTGERTPTSRGSAPCARSASLPCCVSTTTSWNATRPGGRTIPSASIPIAPCCHWSTGRSGWSRRTRRRSSRTRTRTAITAISCSATNGRTRPTWSS